MDPSVLFFISSGIFLGWSLGANHAANVFGTAVMSKMVKYRVAAIVAGVFVTIGAVVGGAGATRTINDLGAVNALAGSFTVALAVGVAVTWMTHLKLPVSTSQAIIGGIIGWNLFTGSPTDGEAIARILGTWMTSPILAALFAFLLYLALERLLKRARIHLLEIDAYTRAGFIIVGAIASYTLGANNIANVMGLFVSAAPFPDVLFPGGMVFTGTEQLFLIGGMAIAVGIYTYGQKVMVTVGNDLYRITPLSGLVVVLAQSIVLFLFSSEVLEGWLRMLHLPTFPLVPQSSTQAVIGGVVGVGLAKQGRAVSWRVLGKIAVGWIVAPATALVLTFVSLYFVQNVFEQRVIVATRYQVSPAVVAAAIGEGVAPAAMKGLAGRTFESANDLRAACERWDELDPPDVSIILRMSKVDSLIVDSTVVQRVPALSTLPDALLRGIGRMHGTLFLHRSDLEEHFRSVQIVRDSIGTSLFDELTAPQRDMLGEAWRKKSSTH